MLRIDIITIFPEMFSGPFSEGMLRIARERGLLNINLVNPRDFTEDRHRSVDDAPYGGGPGMVMKPEPVFRAVRSRFDPAEPRPQVVLLSPQGQTFAQPVAERYARLEHLILICGRYEGIDERVRLGLVDEEISVGDFVLTGGELACMIVVDATARLVPGVLGNDESAGSESFRTGLLDHPSYTRPEVFEGMRVPEVLLSGHHELVRRWRRREALRQTLARRPDLLKAAILTPEDLKLLEELRSEPADHSGNQVDDS
jgi:tRNA (guanine37-N1)-methyltransferase